MRVEFGRRLREHSLFGIDYDGEKRLPRFQFERKQVVPGIREVIAALPAGLKSVGCGGVVLVAESGFGDGREEIAIKSAAMVAQGSRGRSGGSVGERFE